MQIAPIDTNTSPLSSEQAALLNQLISTLGPDQVNWMSGYIAGINNYNSSLMQLTGAMGSTPVASAPAGSKNLTILFGSQSGNAGSLANSFKSKAEAKGFKTKVLDMADFKNNQLKKEDNIFIICSTHGEGVPPDTAGAFHSFVHGKKAPKIDHVNFSVLALGDKSYEFFCKTGQDFDDAFEKMGASRIHDRADCDVDYDDDADTWIESALNNLLEKVGGGSANTAASTAVVAQSAAAFDKKNPFEAEVLSITNLSGHNSDKETLHVELSLEGSGLTYNPGDALGVICENDPDTVNDILKQTAFTGDENIEIKNSKMSLKDALTSYYEISILTRGTIENYLKLAKSKDLEALYNDRDKLNAYLYGRDILDLIIDYPIKGFDVAGLVSILRKLPARLYSIASSLEANEDEVHLTIAAVRYVSQGREKKGACSTFFADRLSDEDTVKVYIQPNKNFSLPENDDAPMIMVGPGTGIAPFRSFVEDRDCRGADGKNWLFYGDQQFTEDFLYQTEWQNYMKSGSLEKMSLAFSRDQEEKIYVQDRLAEASKDIFAWLEDGAYFYVCGDESRMAPDVHKTLLTIISEQGAMSAESAEAYLQNMQQEKRYQRDVY